MTSLMKKHLVQSHLKKLAPPATKLFLVTGKDVSQKKLLPHAGVDPEDPMNVSSLSSAVGCDFRFFHPPN